MNEKVMSIIDNNFPFESYRPKQKEAIYDILKSFTDYDNVILESPVGTGKSVMAATVANFFKTCYYVTIQKFLMEQITNDFEWMVPLKGRNSYPCWFMNEYMKSNKFYCADKGKCAQVNKSFLEACAGKCEYQNQLNITQTAEQVLFNFSSFLYQRTYANRFTDPKKLLVIDEAHNAESQIMNFVEVVINGDDIDHKLPQFDEVSMYISYFKMIDLTGMIASKQVETRERLKAIVGDTKDINFKDLDKEDAELAHKLIRDIDKYESIKKKYNGLLEYVDKIRCVCDFNKNAVTIKPLYASFHVPKLLLPGGKKRLFMSATILSHKVFGKSIGLDMEKTKFIQIPHGFPVANRLIHLDYAGPMDYKNKAKTMPKLMRKINKIMDKHNNEKGIIHCQSFALLQSINEGISVKNRSRLLDQTMFNDKDELLRHHATCTNSVIIAPAMHEGLDLKNDLSRFQIICKIPYPDSRGNRQLEERTKESWDYYLWLTALKLVQSVGRSVRSETDYASTYITDESFDKFFNMCDRAGLLPDWFVESLVVD
jgi:ATP-dependent DNA helicase DinG